VSDEVIEARASPLTVHARLTLLTVLAATFLGTLINNIVNVPLRSITLDFHAHLSAGVLVVSAYVIMLATGMAFSGWVSDRIGRRRTLMGALALMAVAIVGAALAPSLPVLVGLRALQGLACAAIPPAVMGVLSHAFGPDQRARTMGAWAAANGVGQALGPPLGGFIASAWGWRGIFWLLAPITIAALAATARLLPDDRGQRVALHWPGALSLTLGAALLMTAATAVPQRAIPAWADVVLAAGGVICVAGFARVSLRAERPLIQPQLIIETRFLRSAVAAFAQMFALATVIVAVPLYVTGTLGRSTATTGALVFALPVTMVLGAPVVGAVSDRIGARPVLRAGLIALTFAVLALGFYSDRGGHSLAVLSVLLIAIGAGVALVQTPSATGATRSPAGRSGAVLGLFNMLRFGASAFGTAWVAIVYPHGALLVLFGGSAVLLAIGLIVSFAGPDPVPPNAARLMEARVT
jgi:MFS family permease